MPRPPQPDGGTLLSAQLLGPLLVTLDGRVVDTASSRRTRLVLAYVLLHRRSAVVPEVLMDTFWPHVGPAAARNSLHVALTGVRHALHACWRGTVLERRHDHYRLADGVPVWVDVEEFERLCRAGRSADRRGAAEEALCHYAAADGLYGGDLLADDPYADWVADLRESLRLQLIEAQQRLAELHADTGDHASAVLVARRALTVDPCSERMHRRLMSSYLATGQPHLALAQFHRCAEQLWKAHRLPPSPETVALNELLRRARRRPVLRAPATGAGMGDGPRSAPAQRHPVRRRPPVRM